MTELIFVFLTHVTYVWWMLTIANDNLLMKLIYKITLYTCILNKIKQVLRFCENQLYFDFDDFWYINWNITVKINV